MRIAYLVPATSYEFFRVLVPYLERSGHAVTVNGGVDHADLLLAAMLPQTVEWASIVEANASRAVVWHWDQFSFVDYSQQGWPALYRAMPEALDIWSASYETARQLKSSHGYDSFVVGSYVIPEDFGAPPFPVGDYVLYVAPPRSFHKRVQWVERVCDMLGLPFLRTCQGEKRLSRVEYCELVRGCRCYVMAAFEESNATIPALEAAVCNKPLLLSNLPACREEFGDTATYFETWDFGDLRRKLRECYRAADAPAVRERVIRLYGIENVAARITQRLAELELTLSLRDRHE